MRGAPNSPFPRKLQHVTTPPVNLWEKQIPHSGWAGGGVLVEAGEGGGERVLTDRISLTGGAASGDSRNCQRSTISTEFGYSFRLRKKKIY